jgi:hypothetical protein
MKKEITKIDGQSVAKLLGAIYAAFGLIFSLVIGGTIIVGGGNVLVALAAIIGIALLYGVIGYLSMLLMAIIYNFFAKKIGGIVVYMKDVGSSE